MVTLLLRVVPPLCQQGAPLSRAQQPQLLRADIHLCRTRISICRQLSSSWIPSHVAPQTHGRTSPINFQAARIFPGVGEGEDLLKNMEKERRTSKQYGSLERTHVDAEKSAEDVISMADSTITVEDIEGELCKIERIRDILVRRESELRYMMDDIQLCKEITRLKTELQKLVSIPDKDKSKEDREKEEELLKQINKLVETRDFLVDDVEFERLREREEDREMAAFLQSKFPKSLAAKGDPQNQKVASKSQQTSAPFITKTGLTLLKDCCGFTCSVM